jgi:hypothetical protein
MADLDIENPYGYQDKRIGRGTTGSHSAAESNNMDSISEMKARLTALNAGYFTAARMNSMTKNDLLYALRLGSADSAGIN